MSSSLERSLVDDRKKVKIRRKISFLDFAELLKQGTDRIVISDSIVKQSKSLGIMLDTLEKVYNLPNPPTIEILERGKGPRIIKQDWIDPTIRKLVGKHPRGALTIEIKLFNEGAINKTRALKLGEFDIEEIKDISNLKIAGHVTLTNDMRVYLTRLGKQIAIGAKKLYDV